MAVTQTDQGTSLELVARTLLQSGRQVGILAAVLSEEGVSRIWP